MMKKGSFGYIQKKRVFSLVKSILFLCAVLVIYFAALRHYHTNRNVFSILAAVGALPTGRSIVETIMCFRAGSASEKVRQTVEKIPGIDSFLTAYDLYMTSYERAFSVSHITVGNGNITGLSEDRNLDCGLCEQHIKDMLSRDGLSGYRVRITKDADQYAQALRELVSSCEKKEEGEETVTGEADEDRAGSGDHEKDRKVMNLLLSISL